MEIITLAALVAAPLSVVIMAIALVISIRKYSKHLEIHTHELLKGLGNIREQTDPNILSKVLHERMNTTDGVSKLLVASTNAQEHIEKAVMLHSESVNALPKEVSQSISTSIPQVLDKPVHSIRESVSALSTTYNKMGKTLADTMAQFVGMVQTLRDQDGMHDIVERIDQAVASILGTIETLNTSFVAIEKTSNSIEAIAVETQQTYSCLRDQAEALTTQNELYGTNEELFHSSIKNLFENNLRMLHDSQREMQNAAIGIAETVRGDHEVRELLRRSFPSLFQAHERSTQGLAALVPAVEKLCIKYQETLDCLVENWQNNQTDMLKDFHDALVKTRETHLTLIKQMKSEFTEMLDRIKDVQESFFTELKRGQVEMVQEFVLALSKAQGTHSEFLENLRTLTKTYIEGLRKETDISAQQHTKMVELQTDLEKDFQQLLHEQNVAFQSLPQVVAEAVTKGTDELLRDSKHELQEVKMLAAGMQNEFKESAKALNKPAKILTDLVEQHQNTHKYYRTIIWVLLFFLFITAVGSVGQIVLYWLALGK